MSREGAPMTPDLRERIRYARRVLDNLYTDLDRGLEARAIGAWSTKSAVSDAMDLLDKAIASCPRQEEATR